MGKTLAIENPKPRLHIHNAVGEFGKIIRIHKLREHPITSDINIVVGFKTNEIPTAANLPKVNVPYIF